MEDNKERVDTGGGVVERTDNGAAISGLEKQVATEANDLNKDIETGALMQETRTNANNLSGNIAPLKTETIATKRETNQGSRSIESLSYDERANEIISIFRNLTESIHPDSNGSVVLTAEQIQAFDRIDALRAVNTRPMMPADLAEIANRPECVLTANDFKDKKSIKAAKKRIRKALKETRKENKGLEDLVNTYVDYMNAKNEQNYYLNEIGVLGQINQALDKGIYINTPIAFLEQNPLIVKLYKNRNRIKNSPSAQIDGVDIYPATTVQTLTGVTEHFTSCGGYSNVLEQFLSEHTQMNRKQARGAASTLTTIGIIGGAFLGLRWLFTEKGSDGKRSLAFPSIKKIAAAICIPLGLKYGSEMMTGKSFLENLNNLRTKGELPTFFGGDTEAEDLKPTEAMALGQTMQQYVLLGVPFSQLALCASPKTGRVSEIDLNALKTYYQNEQNQARISGDMQRVGILGTQIQSIDQITSSKDAINSFNAYIANLNLTAEQLKDPNNANNTLDEILGKNNLKYQALENYMNRKNLVINKENREEIKQKIFNSNDKLEESDMEKWEEKGYLISKQYESIYNMSVLSSKQKEDFAKAYTKLSKDPKFSGMKFDIISDGKLKITSNGYETNINIMSLTLEGFKDSAGGEIIFQSTEDLLRTALFINKLRGTQEVRGETPDFINWSDVKNTPFTVNSNWTTLFSGNIEFKKNGGGSKLVLSDLVPRLSTMDTNFPTIESGNNRFFFVEYLNRLWRADPQTHKPTSS